MTTFSIDLSGDQTRQLREHAADSGLAPEAFLNAVIKRWLDAPQGDFLEAVEYVLRKNAELYKRLA